MDYSDLHDYPMALEAEKTKIIFLGDVMRYTGNTKVILEDEVVITWCRYTEAKACLVFKGKVIKELQTLNDFYGLMTSVASVIDDKDKVLEFYGIEPNSELELHIIANVFDVPTLGFVKRDLNRNYYRGLKNSAWHYTPDAKINEEISPETFPYDSRKPIKTGKSHDFCVWKSSNNEETNQAMRQQFESFVHSTKRLTEDQTAYYPGF